MQGRYGAYGGILNYHKITVVVKKSQGGKAPLADFFPTLKQRLGW